MGQHHTIWELLALGSIAGVIPVYLGIGAAFLVLKLLNRSWEGFLTGISTGILVYLTGLAADRKSTRLNSSHITISYAVFCLKKKTLHSVAIGSGQCLEEFQALKQV